MMAEQGEVIAVLLSAVGTRQGSSPCQPTAKGLEIIMIQVKFKRLSEKIDKVSRDKILRGFFHRENRILLRKKSDPRFRHNLVLNVLC